jgi:hypothetical protein
MKYEVEIPDPDGNGFRFHWNGDFKISVRCTGDEVVITANADGLRSLANHLIMLSHPDFKSGYHFHLDKWNSLEDGSIDLIIGKE